ncbi:hypothetical protein IT417_00185 [bacterium]|nr:hypothetical protein [bacterium]
MKYLVIDKKQRIETSADATYAITRMTEEFEKMGVEYLFATTDDIDIKIDKTLQISVLGHDLTSFTHILLRGHRLHKPWEYETKKIIADYIDQYNHNNTDKPIRLQNINAFKTISYYDKLYIYKLCTENGISIIPIHYRTSGNYKAQPSLHYPFILKDFTGENDLRVIDGKEKIKKNVYLINNENDLSQENLQGKDTTKYFSQVFVPTGEDIRVFVSKGEAVGGFRRKATEGFMTVLKGEYYSLVMDEEKAIKEFSEKVARVFKADFIAVDVMADEKGNLMLLEISLNPGFKAYETKSVGEHINVAKTIIDSF